MTSLFFLLVKLRLHSFSINLILFILYYIYSFLSFQCSNVDFNLRGWFQRNQSNFLFVFIVLDPDKFHFFDWLILRYWTFILDLAFLLQLKYYKKNVFKLRHSFLINFQLFLNICFAFLYFTCLKFFNILKMLFD